MSPRNNIGKCKGEDQPIEVSVKILDDLDLKEAEATIISHESDQCPFCPELGVNCFPSITWWPQSGRIIAVITQRLKE